MTTALWLMTKKKSQSYQSVFVTVYLISPSNSLCYTKYGISAEKAAASSLRFYLHGDTKISNTTQDERRFWRAHHMNRKRSREEELLCKRCADSKRWATLQNWARWGGTAAHQLGIRKQSCCIEKKQSRNELERNGERWKTCFPPLRPDGWGLQLSGFRLHESSAEYLHVAEAPHDEQ